jgi:Subtilase family
LIAGLEWTLGIPVDIVAALVDLQELTSEQQQRIQALADQLHQQGKLLLAPVGNSGERQPITCYPAASSGVLAIGAHDREQRRCAFSAKSRHTDVLAPGEHLLNTDAGEGPAALMATAYVAGCLALIRQWENQQQPPHRLTPAEWQEKLRQTAIRPADMPVEGHSVEYGYGLFNPMALLP